MRTVLAAAVGLLVLAGCGGTRGPAVLHFGMEDAPEGRRILFPQPPEVPRFMYAGQLVGESNFRVPGAEQRGAFERFWRALIGLDAAEARPTVLQRPVAGSVDESGRIYVTDASRQAVFVFDEKVGELLVWEKARGLTPFASPVGVAPGPDGGIFVADAELGFVAQLDRSGNPVREIGSTLLKRPAGIARDAEQKLLYVADTHAHDVKVFDEQGRLVQLIGRRGEGNGEFNFPTHVAFARGELYVTDTMNSRIQVFNAGGELLERKFGERVLEPADVSEGLWLYRVETELSGFKKFSRDRVEVKVNSMVRVDVTLEVGGHSEFAAGNRTKILRKEDGREIEIRVRHNNLLNKGDLDENVDVRPGDVVAVPQSFF